MSTSPYVISVTEASFDKEVLERSHQTPVMVDFWADWCGPCHMLMPVLGKLADEYGGQFILAKVNSDEQQALAARYGVRSLPTVKIFRHGKEVDEFMGAQPESAVRDILERHIERESDRIRLRAQAALDNGREEEALSLFRQAVETDPGNADAPVDLARALIRHGDLEEAGQLLDGLGRPQQDRADVRGLRARIEFARIAAQAPDTESLSGRIRNDPGDLAARQALAAHAVLREDYESAMQQLLQIMQRDRGFGDDAGRRGLLAIFDMLGGEGELVHRYRSRMFAALH